MPKVPNYLCTSRFTEKKTRTMGKITEMLSNKLRARTWHLAQSHPASQILPTCSFHSHLLSVPCKLSCAWCCNLTQTKILG